jgi:hypothetical protein
MRIGARPDHSPPLAQKGARVYQRRFTQRVIFELSLRFPASRRTQNSKQLRRSVELLARDPAELEEPKQRFFD